jgi:hypothetical protein
LTGTPTSRGTYKKNLTHTVFRTLVIGEKMNREEINANLQLVTALRTEALAIIMKFLWEKGYDKEMVKKAADAWWDMKEKNSANY